MKKKIEVYHEEVISIQNNTIHCSNKLDEKFDVIIVADGIFSRFANKAWEDSLKKINALAYRGVIRGYDSGTTKNVDLFIGNNRHFVFYPINKSGDFSFTSIFASNSNSLSSDYSSASSSEELLGISSNANDEIKKIISFFIMLLLFRIFHFKRQRNGLIIIMKNLEKKNHILVGLVIILTNTQKQLTQQ